MPTWLINSSGEVLTDIIVNKIQETSKARTIVFDMPTANKDVIQDMGDKNKTYTIQGNAIKTGSVALTTLRTNLNNLRGTTGSISGSLISVSEVFYSDVQITDNAGKIYEFPFRVEAIEVL
jgi:hypothetical protein